MNDHLPDNDDILEKCLGEIYDQGMTVDDCLAKYPESKSIEPLLRLSERLQSARHLTAPSDFRLSARDRLEKRLSAKPQTLVKPGNPWSLGKPAPTHRASSRKPATPHSFPNRSTWVYAVGLAVFFIMLLASTTTSYASRSLPGDPLYRVKIASEQFQLALAPSDTEDATLHLKFAEQRFQEMKTLVEEEKTVHLRAAVSSYQEEINTTHGYFTSDQMTGPEKARVLQQLTYQLVDHDQQLSTLLTELSSTHTDASTETVTLIRNETQPAVKLLKMMFSVLQDEIGDDQDLLKEFKDFPGMVMTFEPEENNRTRTPVPQYTETIFLWTSIPGVMNTEEGDSEWPTLELPIRPTLWIAKWATLDPKKAATPLVDLIQTLYPTYVPKSFPTYLPTYLPTYFPADDSDNDPDDDAEEENFPGWEWPDDFPDDDDSGDDDEFPPEWK